MQYVMLLGRITSPIHECSVPKENSRQSGVADLRPLASLLIVWHPWMETSPFIFLCLRPANPNKSCHLVHLGASLYLKCGATKQRIERCVLRGSGMFWIWFSLIVCFLCFLHSVPIPYHSLHMTSVWCCS